MTSEDAPARTAPAHRGARERVDGGLVVSGREQGIRIGAVARDGVLDIGELAGRRDEDGVVEEAQERFPLRRADLGEGDQSHGLMQQEIAGEDRSSIAEQCLSGGVGALRSRPQPEFTADVRDAAADRVVVDDVVVHDERGVQKLERRGDGVEGGLGRAVAAARLERGGDQSGAEPLPAACGRGRSRRRGRSASRRGVEERAWMRPMASSIALSIAAEGAGGSAITMLVVARAARSGRTGAAARPGGRAKG